MLESIPMHTGPMSCYTICAITLMVSAGLLFATIYVRYNSNEFRRIENWAKGEFKKIGSSIDDHDEYIDHTNGIINKIHIDLAVQESSMKDLKQDIAEIKRDIKTLLKRQ